MIPSDGSVQVAARSGTREGSWVEGWFCGTIEERLSSGRKTRRFKSPQTSAEAAPHLWVGDSG